VKFVFIMTLPPRRLRRVWELEPSRLAAISISALVADPNSSDGAKLMGHELAHVAQHRNGLSQADIRHGEDLDEKEADAAGTAFGGRMPFGRVPFKTSAISSVATAAPLQMQRLAAADQEAKKEPLDLLPHIDAKQWEEWRVMRDVKKAIADKIAHEYVRRNEPVQARLTQPPVSTTHSSQPYKWEPSAIGSTGLPALPAATTYIQPDSQSARQRSRFALHVSALTRVDGNESGEQCLIRQHG
jgi:hypothetical protein